MLLPKDLDLEQNLIDIKDSLKYQLERKKNIEDKAKSVLGAITIAVTAITFAFINLEVKGTNVFNLISVSLLAISIISFTMATIRAIQSINLRSYFLNETIYEDNQSGISIITIKEKDEKLKKLIRDKVFNDYTISKSSNYAFASLILVRNGIICFTSFFLFAIIGKSYRPSYSENSSVVKPPNTIKSRQMPDAIKTPIDSTRNIRKK